jgi:hypothetical protein
VLEVPATETDRRMLALILLKEDEELTAEVLEGAVKALRKKVIDRRRQEMSLSHHRPGMDLKAQAALAQERLRMKLARRSPDSQLESSQPTEASEQEIK